MDDLTHLRDYIAGQSGKLTTAERYIERVLARCETIGSAPFAGRHRDDLDSACEWSCSSGAL